MVGRDGQYYKWDVAKVIEYLGRLVIHLAQADEALLASLRLNPECELTSDYLANLLNRRIREMRRRVFHDEKPPFTSYDDAITWMEGRSVELTEDIIMQMTEIQLETLLPYLAGNDVFYIYPKPESDDLWHVVKEAHRVSEKTGFTPISVALYILANIKPMLTPYYWSSISLPVEIDTENGSIKYSRRQVKIQLNTEISWNELLRLYRSIRGTLGVTKKKAAGNKQLELYRLVQERGAPPPKKAK